MQFNSFFSKVSTEDSNGQLDINSSVLSFVWFKVEAVVVVDESCARVWPFGSRDTLLEIVGLADSGMDLMVLFYFCNFFRGLGMLKGMN